MEIEICRNGDLSKGENVTKEVLTRIEQPVHCATCDELIYKSDEGGCDQCARCR